MDNQTEKSQWNIYACSNTGGKNGTMSMGPAGWTPNNGTVSMGPAGWTPNNTNRMGTPVKDIQLEE